MDQREAELIGMHVGDGTLYLAGKTLVWELRGSIHEQEYYEHVAKLIKDMLNIEVKPKYRGPNSYGIQTTNKIITNFFINNGFKPGKKVYTVRIPDYVKLADKTIRQSFVRGLFDTDGCVWFYKNRTPYRYYPKIEFSFASEPLWEDLAPLLDNLGFRVHKWKSQRKDGIEYKICAAGFNNLDRWIKEIKPANSKHIIRIKEGLLNKSKVNLKKRSTNL